VRLSHGHAAAAALLGIQERVGTIAAGMAADFLLLDGDPLGDIRNTRKIALVVKDGSIAGKNAIGGRGATRHAAAPSATTAERRTRARCSCLRGS